MPSNLNALIRYKTINSCLHGGKRKWSIDELIEKCSEALAEYRGIYRQISERTIRDDIRVMRSEILGFSAPIQQDRGLYFYSDPAYSILTVGLTDPDLVLRIIKLLTEIRQDVSHPELEIILEKLGGLSKYEAGRSEDQKTGKIRSRLSSIFDGEEETPLFSGTSDRTFEEPDGKPVLEYGSFSGFLREEKAAPSSGRLVTWQDIFSLLR